MINKCSISNKLDMKSFSFSSFLHVSLLISGAGILVHLEEEDLEVMKKELIAIKEIFITHEEEEPDAASGEKR